MSVVTNIILHCFLDEDEGIAYVQEHLSKRHGRLTDVGALACNSEKAMEQELYAGAFNFLQLDGLIEAVRSAPWERPEWVQLFVCGQEDNLFREIFVRKTDCCSRCGRDMMALGPYSDFVHYRADRTDQTPCLPANQGLDKES